MAYFEWASDMVIDEGPIDDDHRKLVDLVNALHTATSEGRGQEVVEALMDELLRYTQDHLRREEALMANQGFPHLESHRKGHDRFVQSLQQLREKYEAGSITVAAQLSAVLRDWLSLHIRRSDKEIRVHLQQLRKGQLVPKR